VALAPVEPGTHTALRTRARGEGLSLADLALRALVGIAVAALVFLALLPHTGLYRTETVLSNSMKPHFGAGDLLVVTPEPVRDVRVGQVISIHVPNGDHHVQTHRIVQVVRGSRYLKFTFDPGVPAGAVIASVTLNFYYRASGNGDTACWYGEAYNGVTLLASYGSSGTPQSCNTGNTTYSTDTVTLSQLTFANDANAVTDVNALAVRAYMRESAAKKTQIDFAQLNVNYYLN
jgi:hypothetical protein